MIGYTGVLLEDPVATGEGIAMIVTASFRRLFDVYDDAGAEPVFSLFAEGNCARILNGLKAGDKLEIDGGFNEDDGLFYLTHVGLIKC